MVILNMFRFVGEELTWGFSLGVQSRGNVHMELD